MFVRLFVVLFIFLSFFLSFFFAWFKMYLYSGPALTAIKARLCYFLCLISLFVSLLSNIHEAHFVLNHSLTCVTIYTADDDVNISISTRSFLVWCRHVHVICLRFFCKDLKIQHKHLDFLMVTIWWKFETDSLCDFLMEEKKLVVGCRNLSFLNLFNMSMTQLRLVLKTMVLLKA